jgi:hypothetical protein
MPPKAAAEVAVLALTEGAALAEELVPPPAAAELLAELAELVELELLQPAASKIDPNAAATATIVLDARK